MEVAYKLTAIEKFIGVKEILPLFDVYIELLYPFFNLVVGPLSVYVCALNRTFLFVS